MARFIWRFHYIGTILLLLLLVAASPQQFDTASTVDLGDSAIQLAATSLNPDPDALLDTQGTLQPQNSDLLAQQQSPDDNAFTPPLVFLSPQDNQIAETNSQLNSGSCPTNANSKPGASRLLRRAYGEFEPCCDPVNLGLAGPFSWIFGSNSVEERSPYCCEGGGIEYAPMRFCVPCMCNPSSPTLNLTYQLRLFGFSTGNKAHQLCQDPDNWSCCIYGGSVGDPIFLSFVKRTKYKETTIKDC